MGDPIGTATLLAEDIGGYAGPANLYAVDPPVRDPSGQGPASGYPHVVVWVQNYGTPPGAYMVPARPDGSAFVMNQLAGSYAHPQASHTGALFLAGYEVVVPEGVE